MSRQVRPVAAFLLFLAGSFLVSCTPNSVPTQAGKPLTINLKPDLSRTNEVDAVDVAIHLPAPDAESGDVLLTMAIIRVMMPSALQTPEDLTAVDASGPLPLRIEEDDVDPSEFRQDRRWLTTRATKGDVEIRYQLTPREITASTRPGPLIDTRTELTGFYGSGNTMLALPPEGWPQPVRIEWDLTAMPDGARAASSMGEGNTLANVSLENLSNSFFMAGPLQSQPKDGKGDFVVYWITPAAFDLQGAAEWTQAGFNYFSDFFDQHGSAFRIFMRTTERFQGGGGGGFNSFIFGTVDGEDRDPKEVRSLLAHETLHHFVGGYGEGGGAGGQQWYSEGATSYYTIVLPYRAGLTSFEDFISDFNAHALNYYTNPQSGLSNDEVTELFFSDNNAQLVPYNRGPLYFALVDYRLRVETRGARRVDDLIMEFINGRDEAGSSVAYWRELLVGELGEAGGAEFDAMMAGAPLDLPAGLFGPCFTAEDQELMEFKPGFRPYKDDMGITLIGPVIPGSSAEQAGLKRYDAITNPELLEAAASLPPGTAISLNIQRDDEALDITYVPWTAPSPGKQWVRTEAPDGACGL